MSQSTFDETLPWGTLPHFIKHFIFWQVMVKKRNEMGWKALHEQLFPLRYRQMRCWDCGYILEKADCLSVILGYNLESENDHFCCPGCKLRIRKKRYPIALACHHSGLYSRPLELPRYKMHVFGYLAYTTWGQAKKPEVNFHHRLLTGYHISRGTIGDALLVRYFDDDNAYTRQHRVFRPIFLFHDLETTFT